MQELSAPVVIKGKADRNLFLFQSNLQIVAPGASTKPTGLFVGTSKAEGGGFQGDIFLLSTSGEERIALKGNGTLVIRDHSGNVVFNFVSEANMAGKPAGLWLGRAKEDGGGPSLLVMRDDAGADSIVLDGGAATLRLGLKGQAGKIVIRDSEDRDVFRLESPFGAHLFVGAIDHGGLVHVVNHDGKDGILLEGSGVLSVGSSQGGTLGRIDIYDDAGNKRLTLDGKTGDIKLSGADCAEQFEVADPEEVAPGCVLVLGDEGKLRPCGQAYDKRVVGVVSGAGGLSPGIILGETSAPGERSPVAITGKVYCKVDARTAPIEHGDLLTTSPTLGHAMKALDPARALGTVVGKALAGLADGCSLLPILVTLR